MGTSKSKTPSPVVKLVERPTASLKKTTELVKAPAEQLPVNKIITGDKPVFNTIHSHLEHLNTYYGINQRQAKHSFYIGLITFGLGFAMLLVGVLLIYLGTAVEITAGTLTIIGGVITSFISATQFKIYSTSLSQVDRFFDSLFRTQHTMLAVEVCEQISDTTHKDMVKGQMALEILHGSQQSSPRKKNTGPSSHRSKQQHSEVGSQDQAEEPVPNVPASKAIKTPTKNRIKRSRS